MTETAGEGAPAAPSPVPKVVIEPKGGPSATLRDLTERSVTLEANSERLPGVKVLGVLRATNVVLASPPQLEPTAGYPHSNVAPNGSADRSADRLA